MIGALTLRNLKIMISHNIVTSSPETVEDIKVSEKIFGPDVSTLKGRTTRQRPKVAVDIFFKVPR